MAEQEPTPATHRKSAPTNLRRKLLLALLSLTFLAAGVAAGAYWWLVARFYEHTDDAYVATNVVQVTPLVGGTVIAVNVQDTDRVTVGQPLVELDPADTQIALDQAEAELAKTVREVRTLFANNATLAADLGVRRAEYEHLRTDLAKARDDLATRQRLVASGAVGKEELKHAEAALAAAQAAADAGKATIAAAEERLESSRALTEGTSVDKHPHVERAAARVREAYLAHARTTILAPVAGYVAKRSVQVGQRLQAGSPLLSIAPLGEAWVDANFKEGQLAHMRIGQPVTLSVDLYGKRVVFHGRVAGLGAGTGAAFSILPAQNASGNWIKIVQRVPVRIELDPAELEQHPVRVGLSAQVEVDLHHEDGPALAAAPRRNEANRTTIYDDAMHAADDRVKTIIAANLGEKHAAVAAQARGAAARAGLAAAK